MPMRRIAVRATLAAGLILLCRAKVSAQTKPTPLAPAACQAHPAADHFRSRPGGSDFGLAFDGPGDAMPDNAKPDSAKPDSAKPAVQSPTVQSPAVQTPTAGRRTMVSRANRKTVRPMPEAAAESREEGHRAPMVKMGPRGRAVSVRVRDRASRVTGRGPTAGARGPDDGDIERTDPEMAALQKKDREFDRRSRDLVARYRNAPEAEKAKLKQQIMETVNKHFDIRQQRRKLQLDRMQKELERLRTEIEHRDSQRAAIVKQRIQELFGDTGPGF